MAAAQEDDGYLYTAWTARDKIDNPANIICCYPKENKWLEGKLSHELYNLGHMYEAAAAHFSATGKKNFLDVATKSADLLVKTFGPGKMEVPPGHPEVELGLVKLYRVTGDARYLDLAKYFLELRGKPTDDRPELWGEYSQDHKPFRQQDEVVGHSVRAIYLYAGATDVAALTGDRELAAVLDRLWENVVGKKTYVTGGIGATAEGEAFGKNYHLAERIGLLRNLREPGYVLVEPPPVPAPRRCKVHRRVGTGRVQQHDFRYGARRQDVLLSQSAGVDGQLSAQQVVRLRVLPDEPLPVHSVGARLCLCRARRCAVCQSVCRRIGRR